MTNFIIEFIPPKDVKTYKLDEIDKKFVVGGTGARDWTIDRERNIYLRNVATGREDWRSETEWTFYWKGQEMTLRLDLLDGQGERREPGRSHWRLISVNGGHGLSTSLKPLARSFMNDLEEALVAYKDFGVYSTNTDYSVTLDMHPECVL